MATNMNDPSDPLNNLLGGLKPRRPPPGDAQARAWETVRAAWQAQRRPAWQRYGGLAAAVAVTAFALNIWMMRPAEDELCFKLASGADIWAGARHVSGGEQSLCVSAATILRAEQTSRFQSADGVEIRLRAGSEIEWKSVDRVRLSTGAMYVSTHGKGSLIVDTPFGEIADIGTVFAAEVDDQRLIVALREGSVQINTPRGRHLSVARGTASERVIVDSQRVIAEPFPGFDSTLEWIFAAHPGYEEARAHHLLEEIASDLGRSLKYASPDVEARVANTELVGSLTNLGPRQALAVVAGVCDFSVSETSSVLEISERSDQY